MNLCSVVLAVPVTSLRLIINMGSALGCRGSERCLCIDDLRGSWAQAIRRGGECVQLDAERTSIRPGCPAERRADMCTNSFSIPLLTSVDTESVHDLGRCKQ